MKQKYIWRNNGKKLPNSKKDINLQTQKLRNPKQYEYKKTTPKYTMGKAETQR